MEEKPVTIDDLFPVKSEICLLLNNYSLVKELGLEYYLIEKLYERSAVLTSMCERLYKRFK